MSSAISLRSTIGLSSGTHLPILGLGVYQSPPSTCEQSCLTALRAGYRHIDTAQFYGNEAAVGKALAAAIKTGIVASRAEVFVTTKILAAAGSADATYAKCRASVAAIGDVEGDEGAYVDLFLVHSPHAGPEKRREMWCALERLYHEGRARAIGVSNFSRAHIEEMRAYSRDGAAHAAAVWPPHVNQIELHPWCQQKGIVEYCRARGIVIEAYSPLARNMRKDNEVLQRVARGLGRSTAQVLVRYSLQKGWVPLPKSDEEIRIKENADVFDWEIGDEGMRVLNALDQGTGGAIVEAVEEDDDDE